MKNNDFDEFFSDATCKKCKKSIDGVWIFISLRVVKSFPDFKWFVSTGILAFFCQDYYRCSRFGK